MTADKHFFVNGQQATKAEAGVKDEAGEAYPATAGAAPKLRGGG